MALALVVCFQEIKLNVINSALMMETLGPSFDEFYYLPASQTRGGILLAWNSSKASCHTTSLGEYSIIAKVVLPNGSSTWLTVVYGPHEDGSKNTFLQELCHIHSSFLGPWMVLGDFNLILQLQDKNNACVNRRRMGSFHHLMDDLELREVHLNGRAFTWSSATERLTLERIDRVFVTADWETLFPDCFLRALPSTTSDHCPLLLSTVFQFGAKKRFCFESFWTKIDGFEATVQRAWYCPLAIQDPLRRLDYLLKATSRVLQS